MFHSITILTSERLAADFTSALHSVTCDIVYTVACMAKVMRLRNDVCSCGVRGAFRKSYRVDKQSEGLLEVFAAHGPCAGHDDSSGRLGLS